MSDSFRIPIVDLRAQYRRIEKEISEAVRGVLEAQSFILGPTVARFETRMAAYLRCPAAVGVASGSDALLLALMALGIGPGDGVLVPTFTFFSTASAVTRLGATPLFLDVDLQDYVITPGAVRDFLERRCRREGERWIDGRTGTAVKAVIPVHLFGRCVAMEELCEVARAYRLRVVEDAAQACGAQAMVSGTKRFAGAIGDLGCFSFFPSKTLGGYGDGGLVAVADEEHAARLRMLRMHGERVKYHHEIIGLNSRLDALQAAVLEVKLSYLDGWCERRIERAQRYGRLFADSGLVERWIRSVPVHDGSRSHVFNNYVIRAQRRDELKAFLGNRGIQTEIYYPVPLHLQHCFAEWGYRRGDFPGAETAAGEVLALPLFPELSDAQQETVVESLVTFYRA